MNALSFLMAVLDSYATFRINQSILGDLVWAKKALNLDVEDEIAEFYEHYVQWDYVLRLGGSASTLHIEDRDDGRFMTFWHHPYYGRADVRMFSSLSEAAAALFPIVRDAREFDRDLRAGQLELQREQRDAELEYERSHEPYPGDEVDVGFDEVVGPD